jgi:hypothetical protein
MIIDDMMNAENCIPNAILHPSSMIAIRFVSCCVFASY